MSELRRKTIIDYCSRFLRNLFVVLVVGVNRKRKKIEKTPLKSTIFFIKFYRKMNVYICTCDDWKKSSCQKNQFQKKKNVNIIVNKK